MLGLEWEQHFKGIVRELTALNLCARQLFCFCLVLVGAVLVTGVPVWPGATWERRSVLKRRGSRRAAFLSGHLQERTPFRHAVLS